MNRRLLLAGAAASALALGGIAAAFLMRNTTTPLAPDDLGRGAYRLDSTLGAEFTEASLIGAPSAVFFGYTHCPDVCPTTMGDVALWKEALGPAGEGLRVWFITVDPERDALDVLTDYTSWIPGVVGVTGARPEVEKAIRAFRVFAAKVPGEGTDYTMDHSSSVLLFDASGRFATTIPYQAAPELAAERLRMVIGG